MRIKTTKKEEEFKNSNQLDEMIALSNQESLGAVEAKKKETALIKLTDFLEITADGVFLKQGTLKSKNFVRNLKGWAIDAEGNAWFKVVTAAGYVQTFRQAAIPTSLHAGDIWYKSDDSDKMYRAAAAGATTIAAGAWVRVDVGANPTLIDALATTNAPADAAATAGANWTTNLSNIPEIRGWSHNLVFSVTDADTVAWATGTVNLPSGSNYTIDAGNTGNMAAKTYVYFDKAVSQTVLQTTTTASDAVGTNKILIAVCQNSTSEAVFQVFGGIGGLNIKGADIETGSLTANEIAANTITAGKMSVSTLSSIVADLGAITAGTITVDSAGHIKGGQTAYNTGTGFFLGYSTDAYKFSLGNTNNYVTWNGILLTLKAVLNLLGTLQLKSYTVANLPVTAPTDGFRSPSATGDDHNQWTNPTNAYSSDDNRATSGAFPSLQDYYNFNFSIPDGATINGIEIQVEGYRDPAGGTCGYELSNDGGTTWSTQKVESFNAGPGDQTLLEGGAADLWGLTWDKDKLSNTNFRVRLEGGTGMNVDHIQIKIYYTDNQAPIVAGSTAYASNGRKNGEGAGVGTGVLVFYDGSNWIACDTGQTVAA